MGRGIGNEKDQSFSEVIIINWKQSTTSESLSTNYYEIK